MPPTAEQTKKGYARLWDEAAILDSKRSDAAIWAGKIIEQKDRLKKIEAAIGVPWILTGVLWMRESSLNEKTHLHNGDPLTQFTRHVPANRPKVGHGPPFTWEESALDALTMPGKAFDKLKGKWTLELMLFCAEGYNGWGYLNKGNSPYIWSWTTQYHGGKYVADHVYDPDVWDKQPGCAAIMKMLAVKDADASAWVSRRAVPEAGLPAEAIKEQTRKERAATAAGSGAVVVGGGTTTMPAPDLPGAVVTMSLVGSSILLIGIAVVLVAGFLANRKQRQLKAHFEGE